MRRAKSSLHVPFPGSPCILNPEICGGLVSTLSTTAQPGPTAPSGATLSDTAAVTIGFSTGQSAAIIGSVTFKLYGPDDPSCSGTPVYTDADKPVSAGIASSGNYPATADGVYHWIASYTGGGADRRRHLRRRVRDDAGGQGDSVTQDERDDGRPRPHADPRQGDDLRRLLAHRHDHLQALRPRRHDLHGHAAVQHHEDGHRKRLVPVGRLLRRDQGGRLSLGRLLRRRRQQQRRRGQLQRPERDVDARAALVVAQHQRYDHRACPAARSPMPRRSSTGRRALRSRPAR